MYNGVIVELETKSCTHSCIVLTTLFLPPGGGSVHAGPWSGDPGAVCVSGGEPEDPARDYLHHWTRDLQDTLCI